MSAETRSLACCLQDFRSSAVRDGLSRSDIAKELWQLRQTGRDFAKQELQQHYRDSRRAACL